MVKYQQVVDPPSGWRYGWPRILTNDENYEEHLRKNGYPEKDISFAMKWSRFWKEEIPE